MQASVYGRSQLRLESAAAADSGHCHHRHHRGHHHYLCHLDHHHHCGHHHHHYPYDNQDKTIQATTPASLSEAGRCLTQSATASASKVEILLFPLSPLKMPLLLIHQQMCRMNIFHCSSTKAANNKGSQSDEQFHIIAVRTIIPLPMMHSVIMIPAATIFRLQVNTTMPGSMF